MSSDAAGFRALEWRGEALWLLDQRALPEEERWLELTSWEEVAWAIREMVVRGAPAIGVAAAYGMVLAALKGKDRLKASEGLADARPTAVNLFWALERMAKVEPWTPEAALAEAQAIEAEDVAVNQAIGAVGARALRDPVRILTICNTGSLATAGFGTALGIVRAVHAEGRLQALFACETRPRLQGLRLTAWELLRDGIPFQVIPDGAAGALMAKGEVTAVIVGADRIAANGDTANKIGTYSLAVLAHHHGIPFYVAAPLSTLDPSTSTGKDIPIEERDASEVVEVQGIPMGPRGCPVWNPAFDVTPAKWIAGILTERGMFEPPYAFEQSLGKKDCR